ncbi:hypothetical protein CALVIDRAFT_589486 [Calocera viscosa TUFC12733]|uniref:Uncharacterized protein n=1 Tax=Calocera viscosa (strain TUFC12733) TaxID=1330018 RepID=A0A167GV89_CALVF|nr:hypothetical protein CALVIDRAFT_589486 [Calocera viscosa TUFC12733]
MKRIQRGRVGGILFKLQEEEHERKNNYVLDVREAGLDIDPDTKALLTHLTSDIKVKIVQPVTASAAAERLRHDRRTPSRASGRG